MANEEYLMKLSMLEQKMQEMQQQVALIDRQIAEITILHHNLGEIKGKKNEEILSHVGKGIYAKSKLVENDELIVDVGSKVFLKKNFSETKEIIDKQIWEMNNVKNMFLEELSKISMQAERLILEAEAQAASQKEEK